MDKYLKVLVVEDDSFIIENLYKSYLSSLNLHLDYAQSKIEALEKIHCKTYNIAFVDIMLIEDQNDRGGVDVIKYFNKVNEGTAIIVVSATDDIRVALTTYKTGIVDFIQKENVHTKKDILEPIEKITKHYDQYSLNYFGKFSTLSAYLASPELTPYWEHTIQSTIRSNYDMMVSIFSSALDNFLPICRNKNTKFSLKTDNNSKCVYGDFWSKGIGSAIWFSVAHKDGVLLEPPDEIIDDELYSRSKGSLCTKIWKIISVKRDQYYDFVWEDF